MSSRRSAATVRSAFPGKRRRSLPTAEDDAHHILPASDGADVVAAHGEKASDVPPKKKNRHDHSGAGSSASVRVSPIPGGAAFASLPPVTVSHPSGTAHQQVRQRVSYGDLTPEEIAAVLHRREVAASAPKVSSASRASVHAPPSEHAPVGPPFTQAASPEYVSDADDTDHSDAVGADRSGYDAGASEGHPFVDDIADEDNGASASWSALENASECEGDDTSDTPAEGADGTGLFAKAHIVDELAVLPDAVRSSGRSRTKTEKGEYLKTMLDSGLVDDLVDADNVQADPSIAISVKKTRRAVADSTVEHVADRDPTVYLEDLGYPPVPVRSSATRGRSNKPFKAPVAPPGSTLQVQVDVSSALRNNAHSGTVEKTLFTGSPSASSAASKKRATTRQTPSAPSVVRTEQPAASPPGPISVPEGPVPSVSGGAEGAAVVDPFIAGLDALIGSDYDDVPEEEEDIVQTDVSQQPPASSLVDTPGNPPVQDLNEPDDEACRVMLPELQEAQLVAQYAMLASIGYYRAVIAPGSTPENFEHPPCISLDEIRKFFPHDTIRCFIAYLKFFGHAPYCNMSTMPRSAFTSDGKKALYSSMTAVAMIVGVVTECFLHNVTREGGYDAESAQPGLTFIQGGRAYHSITLMPFRQLWRRESTMLGLIFRLPYMKTSSISAKGPEFTTRSYAPGTDFNKNKVTSPAQQRSPSTSGGSTPRKTGSSWPGSPVKRGTLSSSPKEYYHCLGFEDDVPVFDGRASQGSHFLFRPSDFDNLASMPRYGTVRDLDYFSMVAVGYTPTVWTTKREARLSMNVQFVVLLGQAPKRDALAAAGYVA